MKSTWPQANRQKARPADPLARLTRTDLHHLAGNQMTAYCSSLGGGAICYWDGKRVSFLPTLSLADTTAFVEVLDARTGINLLQQIHHIWRPDRIESQYYTHQKVNIWERKTIHDDTFVALMDFTYGEGDADLVVRIRGEIKPGTTASFAGNRLALRIEAVPGEWMKRQFRPENRCRRSTVYKVIGFSRPTRCRLTALTYTLEFPLAIRSDMGERHAVHHPVTLVVAGGDTRPQARRRFAKALARPEAAFQARTREWRAYFRKNVPALECDNPTVEKMYAYIAAMIKGNVYDLRRGYFTRPFVSTGKFRLWAQWFWDHAFGAMDEKWLKGLPLPRSSMTNCLKAQRPDGRLPFALCADQDGFRTDYIQPFILCLAVWDYYLMSGDKAFLKMALPILRTFDDWMMANRDPNREDLVSLHFPGESGWDNAKRYILHRHLVMPESPMIKHKRYIQSPDFNTYVGVGRRLMARMARALGQGGLAADMERKASRTEAGIRAMWDGSAGLFRDRFEDNHEAIRVRTPGGVIPLLGGFCEVGQVRAMVKLLTDPRVFWTRFPVASLDLQDPDFNDRDEYFSYWNGRVWPQINWLLIESLARGRRYAEARELAKLSLRLCTATGEAWCMETYDPHTGRPHLTHNCFDYIWGGMFNDILLRRIMGIQPWAPADAVIVNPLLNEDFARARICGVRVGRHEIDVELERRSAGPTGLTSRTSLTFTHRGRRPITLITSAGRCRVHNRTVRLAIAHFDAPHWLEL
jgi:hypothetical protein